jgi:hypothetical protein
MVNNSAVGSSLTINASAVCSGDLAAYHFTFPHGARKETSAYRAAISAAFATLINRALDEGRMPPAATETVVNFLLKGARGAAALDPTNENSYRPITMGRAAAKIVGLAIIKRIIHWLRTHRVVSTSAQGAFTASLGGAYHAWTLFEAIKRAWREGRDVYVLFIDFCKAYDVVDVTTLYELLRFLGVPENLVTLLHNWALERRSAVSVNGVLSELIRVVNGVGQGEVPAPTLFNIFIETLARRVKAAGLACTIRPAGVGIELTLFADDVSEPSLTMAGIKTVADITAQWGADFGMKMNFNAGKTEALAFVRPYKKMHALEPIVLACGAIVNWTPSYKYLGFPLTRSLSTASLVASLRSTLAGASGQLSSYNGVVRRLDISTRVMLHKSLVTSKISYVLAFLNVTGAAVVAIDTPTHRVARELLRLYERTPVSLLATESGLPGAVFLIVRARIHLALSLTLSLERDVPAVALHAALTNEVGRGLLHGPSPSWTATTAAMIATFEALGVPPPKAASRHQIASVAKSYARACALADLRRRLRADGVVLAHPSTARPTHSAKAKQAVADAFLGFSSDAAALGAAGAATPLSACGPGCSGALLRLVSRRALNSGECPVISTIARSRLGATSLTIKPCAPAAWLLDPDDKFFNVSTIESDDYAEAARGHACPLCSSAHSADPWHLLNECTHPAVLAAATRCRARLDAHVAVLAKLVREAHGGGGDPLLGPAVRAAHADVSAAAQRFDWASDEAPFLVFRLVLVLPFPAAVCGDAARGRSLTASLGRLFDAVCVRDSNLRALANYWADWGGRAYKLVASAWRDAVDGLPP